MAIELEPFLNVVNQGHRLITLTVMKIVKQIHIPQDQFQKIGPEVPQKGEVTEAGV